MAVADKHLLIREGDWRLAILAQHCPRESWLEVLQLVHRQSPSKHPQTVKVRFPELMRGRPLYLKVFHPPRGMSVFKDLFRHSKALRALRQGVALAGAGFNVPMIIAAGEQRRGLWLRRAFTLSVDVGGDTIPNFLRARSGFHGTKDELNEKRKLLKQVAETIRRMHQLGFVHGDLVPTNILISIQPGLGLRIFFIDNDRTRRYAGWLPQPFWKRNLIQLNRMPLPGITLQDRMRFFRAYSANRGQSRRRRRFLKWLEIKTRQRRRQCDAIEPKGSFRRLMSWEVSGRSR